MNGLRPVQDVREMIARDPVNPAEALIQFEAIDPATFRKAVDELFTE